MKTKREILAYSQRCLVMVAGLFLMTLGVAISTKANLGTSPISSLPYVLSLGLPWSMGLISIVMNAGFIVLQIILLRKNFRSRMLLQLPVVIIFGYFTDFTLSMVAGIHVSNYFVEWLLCFLSFIVIGFGVFLTVKANVVMMAGDGLIKAIAQVINKEFGAIKIYFDSTLVISSTIISLSMLHGLYGVREGTFGAALMVGTFVKLSDRLYNRFLTKEKVN